MPAVFIPAHAWFTPDVGTFCLGLDVHVPEDVSSCLADLCYDSFIVG